MGRIEINLEQQRLTLFDGSRPIIDYLVSTASNGAGEFQGSGCTPRGRHRIRICIGEGEPVNAVFRGRRPTGEIYSEALASRFPGRDWILTRILWLSGSESGRNRGGKRDTLRRFIYIHGCPDSEPMGEPGSHGCIRMRNSDILDLFPQLEAGMEVEIR